MCFRRVLTGVFFSEEAKMILERSWWRETYIASSECTGVLVSLPEGLYVTFFTLKAEAIFSESLLPKK